MPKELPMYRENLRFILEYSGGVHLLTVDQVRKYTGLTDCRTIKRQFPYFRGKYIAATALAMCMSGGTPGRSTA